MQYSHVTVNGGTGLVSHRVIVPSGATLDGNATLKQNYITDVDYTGVDMLEIPAGSSNISISGLTFSGNHVSGWTNAQMAAIGIRGTTCQNITVTNCTFQNLVGFSVHAESGGNNIDVTDCTFTNCGNGLNVNASNSEYSRNTFTDSEGIEVSASNVTVEDNEFTGAQAVAISLGGDIGGTHLTGCVVQNNTIHSVVISNGSTAHGIIVADGIDSAVITGNVIENCEQIGLVLTVATTFVQDVEFTLNTVRGSGTIGIYIPNIAGLTNTLIDNNLVENGGAAAYGLQNANASVTITSNDFRGSGNNQDVLLQSTSAGCTFTSNQYTTILDQR